MPERVARFLVLSASNRLICGDWVGGRWQNTGIGGTTHGGAEFCTPAVEVAERVEALSGLPWPGAPVADACPLFVELCCGSAAVTLKLLGGAAARPPVSYMGAKTGYAEPILWTLGLRSGQGAAAVLLNDPGPWSRVWRVLTTPAGCAEVARIIRGWVGEDARALWERLRAEPVPDDEGEAAAASWLYQMRGSYHGKSPEAGIGHPEGLPASEHFGGVRPAAEMLDGWMIDRLRFPAGTLVLGEDAADVTPEWVARWLVLRHGTQQQDERLRPCSRILDGMMYADGNWRNPIPPHVDRLDDLPAIPAAVSNLDAAAIEPVPPLPPGTCVYIDPPYQGTTGYAHTFDRAAVLDVARRWADAGARVAVSEAEPLDLPGWHHVEITGIRKGQKRTFSKQKREWLTLSHPPAWTPEQQIGLFG
jgi:hypothetical protein